MRVDRFLQNHFHWIVVVLLAVAAYVQARGIVRLVEAALESGAIRTPSASAAARSPPSTGDRDVSADAILARNPFDSTTGPLDREGTSPTALAQSEAAESPCPGMRVVLIATSSDQGDSFAAITGSGGIPILRREGDAVDGALVRQIRWDRIELTSREKPCSLKLGDAAAEKKVLPQSSPAAKTGLLGDVLGRIRKVGEREFDVDRSTIDVVLEHAAELLGRVHVRPQKEGEEVVGLALGGIQPESLLGAIGLLNGDQLRSINGFDLGDPERTLEAYARLRGADRLDIAIVRGKSPMTIDLNIQ